MARSAQASTAAGSHLHVLTAFAEGSTLISLIGELDLATAPGLGATLDALIADGSRRLTFDVAELAFVDPYGLRPMVQARRDLLVAGERPDPVLLRSPRPGLLALLAATRLTDALPVELAA
jgi:anti-sigma B factor antagonist